MQNGRWRVRLVGRGDIFMEIAVHSAITRIAEAMLGTGFVMGGLSAHTITAGAPPQGVHVVHIVVDGGSRSDRRPDPGADTLIDPDAIAEAAFAAIRQHRSAWAAEIELRPWVETF